MLPLLGIDRSAADSLQEQLYKQLQQLIANGHLRPGSRMIATRTLAENLGLSRNTILLVYERLNAEGYLETRPAMGTFVSSDPPERLNGTRTSAQAERPTPAGGGARRVLEPPAMPADLAPSAFPYRAWRRLLLSILDTQSAGAMLYPPAGIEELRQAIVEWLAVSRGIEAAPDDAIVLAGRHQAYDIAARLVLRHGRRAVVECPGHPGAAAAFAAMGATLVHVEVDDDGIDVDLLPRGDVALAHVTPSHQHPIGGTLPLSRRRALIEWAARVGAYVIEDDCGGEFHYSGKRPPALKQLDAHGRVLYVGSFGPSLGLHSSLGFLLLPPALRGPALASPSLRDNANLAVPQRILAKLIDSGAFARHLRRVRKVCLARRECLIAALRETFGDVSLAGTEDGTHLTWLLPADAPPAGVIARLAVGGLALWSWPEPDDLAIPAPPARDADRLLFIGYAATPEPQIRKDVTRLASALSKLRAAASRPVVVAARRVADWQQNQPGTMPFLDPGPSNE